MPVDISALLLALQQPSVEQRQQAAQTLSTAGPDARPAAVPLVDAASDPDDEVRQWASSALEELGPPPASAVPELVRRLSAAQPDTAYWAATLLGRLGPDARPAASELAKALDAARPLPVRQQAAWALGKIGGAREALQAVADDPDPRLRRLVRAALDAG